MLPFGLRPRTGELLVARVEQDQPALRQVILYVARRGGGERRLAFGHRPVEEGVEMGERVVLRDRRPCTPLTLIVVKRALMAF